MPRYAIRTMPTVEETLPPTIKSTNKKRYTSSVGNITHDLDGGTLFFHDYNLELTDAEIKANKDFYGGGRSAMEIRAAFALFGQGEFIDEYEEPTKYELIRTRFVRKSYDEIYNS